MRILLVGTVAVARVVRGAKLAGDGGLVEKTTTVSPPSAITSSSFEPLFAFKEGEDGNPLDAPSTEPTSGSLGGSGEAPVYGHCRD